MDDLELIERFRADVTEDARAATSARAALMDAMASPRTPEPRRRGPRAARALAIAAVVAAIALLAPAVLPGGERTTAVAAALQGAAQVAAAQPWTAVGPGEFVYAESEAEWRVTGGRPSADFLGMLGRNGSGGIFLAGEVAGQDGVVQGRREIWIGPDGSGRIVETVGDEEQDQAFEAGGLFYWDVSTIPTDLEELRSYVDEHSGPPTPADAAPDEAPDDLQAFELIGLLLRETDASPELRAALYELAASIPGVELIGEVADDAGRPGIAVGYTFGGVRHELIFDPDTSAILGERSVQVGDGGNAAAGTVHAWVVYLRSGVVGSVDQRP